MNVISRKPDCLIVALITTSLLWTIAGDGRPTKAWGFAKTAAQESPSSAQEPDQRQAAWWLRAAADYTMEANAESQVNRENKLSTILNLMADAGDEDGMMALARHLKGTGSPPDLAALMAAGLVAERLATVTERRAAAKQYGPGNPFKGAGRQQLRLAAAALDTDGSPWRARKYLQIAEAQAEVGDRVAARTTLKLAHAALVARRSIGRVEEAVELASARLAVGDAAGARATLTHIKSRLAAGPYPSGFFYRQVALAQAKAGDAAGSRDSFKLALAAEHLKNPPYGGDMVDLAAAQAEAGDLAGGLRTADGVEPSYRPAAFAAVALTQARAGDFARGQEILAGIRFSSRAARSDAYCELALVYVSAGDLGGAIDVLAEQVDVPAAATTPGPFRAHCQLAIAQAAAGDPAGAAARVASARDGLTPGPLGHSVEARRLVADALVKLGDFDGAGAVLDLMPTRDAYAHVRRLAEEELVLAIVSDGDAEAAARRVASLADPAWRAEIAIAVVRALSTGAPGRVAPPRPARRHARRWPQPPRDPRRRHDHRPRLTLTIPRLELACMSLSPDGKTLVAGGAERGKDGPGLNLYIYDLDTGKSRDTLRAHDGSTRCITFAPDGKSFATGGQDQTVRIWDTATRKVRAKLVGHEHAVTSIAFSRDGQTLASCGSDLRLWDVETGALRGTRREVPAVIGVAFLDDGTSLALRSEPMEGIPLPLLVLVPVSDLDKPLAVTHLRDPFREERRGGRTLRTGVIDQELSLCPPAGTVSVGGETVARLVLGQGGRLELWGRGGGASIATFQPPFDQVTAGVISAHGTRAAVAGFKSGRAANRTTAVAIWDVPKFAEDQQERRRARAPAPAATKVPTAAK